jgi:hypothetical protein
MALALRGIQGIAARNDLADGDWPSPVLPSELGQEADWTGLDDQLALVLEQGHLDEIARRPRLNLRYETELVAVDRARRLATGFQRHLAAHSECWASRRLSGIVPKAVLARVSDDDTDLYEHRVYARLLDRLERYLSGRIRRIERLAQGYEQALEFERAETVDYRVRHAICDLWGQAVSPDTATEILHRNRELLERLRRWLKRIRGLKGRRAAELPGSLYDSIPRAAEVDLNLQATNLLQHDPHYRHLRLLWRAWVDATAASRESPMQVLERRRAEQHDYERYVGLVLVRSLRELGFQVTVRNAAQVDATHPELREELRLHLADRQWTLSDSTRNLVLVPAAVALDQTTAIQWITYASADGREIRIPCVPFSDGTMPDVAPTRCLDKEAGALTLSPLDLYCEERVLALIDGWLYQGRLADYGAPFLRLPRLVADAWPKDVLPGFALRKPLSDGEWKALDSALNQYANRELRERVGQIRSRINRLGHCPACGDRATTFSPSADGFYARCECGWEWVLSNGRFRFGQRGEATGSFLQHGRYAGDLPRSEADGIVHKG